VAAFFFLALAPGCRSAPEGGASDHFRVNLGTEPPSLDWSLATDHVSFNVIANLMVGLTEFNQDLKPAPVVAKSWDILDGGKKIVFRLRDDVSWSDGKKVTAEDYVYTLKNLMFSDWLPYPYKDDWQEEVNGEPVFVTPEVVDDTTFTITRRTVDPEFVYNVYDIIPYPKYIATKYEGDVEAFIKAPEFNNLTFTGNLGPYKFSEWLRNDRFVLERNPGALWQDKETIL